MLPDEPVIKTRMAGTDGRVTPWETVKRRFHQLARQFQELGDTSTGAYQRVWQVFQRVIRASLGELSSATCEQVTAFLEEQIDWTAKHGEIPPLFRIKDDGETITARDRDRIWQKLCSYSREELELLQDFSDALPGLPVVLVINQLVEHRLEQLDQQDTTNWQVAGEE